MLTFSFLVLFLNIYNVPMGVNRWLHVFVFVFPFTAAILLINYTYFTMMLIVERIVHLFFS